MSELKFVKIVRGDGKSFQFGETFVETEIEGAGTLTREIFSEPKAIGHGSHKTGSRIPPRPIIIRSNSVHADVNGINRQLVDAFFKPEDTYRVIINYKNEARWIKGEIEVYHLPLEYVNAPQVFELEMFCADPLFRSMDEFGKDIAHITPMFGWPAFYPSEKPKEGVALGAIYGVYDFTRRVFLNNDGDFPTAPRIRVRARDEVKNVELIKSDAEFIKVIDTMAAGDEYEIDFEEQTITKNGQNVNRLLDKNSTYFTIGLGGIEIEYRAEIGDNQLEISVYYNQLYKGVL